MTDAIRIEGLRPVLKKLDRLADPDAFKRPMNQAVQHLHRRIAKYPKKPSHSTYRRTGTLGRKWTTKVENNGRRGEVGNNVNYAIYVQGPKRRHFHKATGWKTIAEVAEQEQGAVVGYFEAEFKRRAK